MKSLITGFTVILLVYSNITYGQNNFYSYSAYNQDVYDKPSFFNVDSLLSLQNYKLTDYVYRSIDKKTANDEMEVLGEFQSKSFTKEIDHTFIRDIGILVVDGINRDTIKLKLREYVYKDSMEAAKVFHHLNKKVVSAVIVPHYRIIYKEKNRIYFVSLLEYNKHLKKQLPKIVNAIYDVLAARNNNLYLLFHYDRRIRTNKKNK